MSTEVSPVRTVNRIAEILNCFSCEEPALNLTTISNRLGLPKSTVHRLLSALESQGFLCREPNSRGFQLGYQLLHWGMVAQAALDLRSEALPILHELSRSTGETAILSVRDGMHGICLEMVESSQPVRLAMRVGQHLRLHAGASAKVLWAFLPETEIQHILAGIDLLPLLPNTIGNPEDMCRELYDIRKRGYATSFEETDPGVMGVAAPVYDRYGCAVAGIGIAAPISRIPRQRVSAVAPSVIEAGRRLSARLGAPASILDRHGEDSM